MRIWEGWGRRRRGVGGVETVQEVRERRERRREESAEAAGVKRRSVRIAFETEEGTETKTNRSTSPLPD